MKTSFIHLISGAGGAEVSRAAGGRAAAPPGGDALAGGGQADRRLRAEEGHRDGHRGEEGGHAQEGTGKHEILIIKMINNGFTQIHINLDLRNLQMICVCCRRERTGFLRSGGGGRAGRPSPSAAPRRGRSTPTSTAPTPTSGRRPTGGSHYLANNKIFRNIRALSNFQSN